jgi:hypothetical protein
MYLDLAILDGVATCDAERDLVTLVIEKRMGLASLVAQDRS